MLTANRVAVAASAQAKRLGMPETASAWRGRRLAFAAAALLLFSAAGATAALYARTNRAAEAGPSLRRSPEARSVRAAAPQQAVSEVEPAPQALSSHKSQRLHRALSPQESYAAELYLLQRAQSEYASQDFPDALVLVAEHARRFPNGRLAEEREALRVRSLAGAGRGDQARRALGAFAKRFPRSALLPRLREQARAAE